MPLTFEDLPDDVHHRILDTIACPKCFNNLISASPSCLRVLQVRRRSALWRLAQRAIPAIISEKLRTVHHLDVETVLIERLLRTFQKSLLEGVRQLQFFTPMAPHSPHFKYFRPFLNYPRRDSLSGHVCNIGCSSSCFDRSAPCVTQTVLEIILPVLWTRDEPPNHEHVWNDISQAGPGLKWAPPMSWNAIEQAMVQTMVQTMGLKLICSKLQMHHINCPVDLVVECRSTSRYQPSGSFSWDREQDSRLIFWFDLLEGSAEAVEQYMKQHWGPWDESFLSQNGEKRPTGLKARFPWDILHINKRSE